MNELDDEQRQLIRYPLRELTLHCIYKGFQLGSTVSLITILPYQYYKLKQNRSFKNILTRVGTSTIYGNIIGVSLSLGLMHYKLSKENYNEYKIWDRAYRLRYSQSQIRTDKFVLTSSIFGGLTGFFIGLPTKYNILSTIKGGFIGIPFGLLAHIISQPFSNKTKSDK